MSPSVRNFGPNRGPGGQSPTLAWSKSATGYNQTYVTFTTREGKYSKRNSIDLLLPEPLVPVHNFNKQMGDSYFRNSYFLVVFFIKSYTCYYPF